MSEKSNLVLHAERELKAAGIDSLDSDYGGMLYEAVMELVETFSKQGHSGASAARTLQLFGKVADYKPLLSIKGTDDEWLCDSTNSKMCQNKRLSSLFKETNDSKAYYLNAIVWTGEEPGDSFTGKVEEVQSRQFVKFPFQPKTFYIDVITGEDGEYKIKDREQLKEVAEYYDMS